MTFGLGLWGDLKFNRGFEKSGFHYKCVAVQILFSP